MGPPGFMASPRRQGTESGTGASGIGSASSSPRGVLLGVDPVPNQGGRDHFIVEVLDKEEVDEQEI